MRRHINFDDAMDRPYTIHTGPYRGRRPERRMRKAPIFPATECQYRCQIFVTRRFKYPFMAFKTAHAWFFFFSCVCFLCVVHHLVAFQYLIKYDKINRRTMAYRHSSLLLLVVSVLALPARIHVAIHGVAIVCVRRRTYERDIKFHFLQSCDATHTDTHSGNPTSLKA